MKATCPLRRRRIRIFVAFAVPAVAAAIAGAVPTPTSASNEEFFIVSSVDAGKSTMVLKRPTEVTLSMRITGKTRCRDEDGKPILFTDLRAGDTIFIASDRDRSGQLVASSIRKGPMTVRELHQRYLRF